MNLNQFVKETGRLLRGSLPSTTLVNTHVPQEAIFGTLDASRIQQVMVNLALNADEAMAHRGQIDITLGTRYRQETRCSSCLASFSGDFITLEMLDTGCGIEGYIENIFDPFHTTKPVGEGPGLGLSVVHGIVHDHHGHVVVANRATNGCQVTVYLPTEPITQAIPSLGRRVLLVEETPNPSQSLETLLTQDGYNVISSRSPTAGLAKFVADPDAFDMIVTDQLMAEASGLELAGNIHALRPDLPIVLTTAKPDLLPTQALHKAGITAVFAKPITASTFLAKIRRLLPQMPN